MTNIKRKAPPGDFAIWIFIFAELSVFAIFFLAYAFARYNNVEMFNEYQATLDKTAGMINTIALLTSSLFVAMAVHFMQKNEIKKTTFYLYLSIVMGFIFLVVKSYEYSHIFGEGISLSTNLFYMFYISLTFFHFMHVLLGMIILLAVAVKNQQGAYSSSNMAGLETGASYWHMVDLVWVILFPLVYIIK
ncbi:MAG: cytochrome c oxidase subunit 3 family protein [Gammaproteobacteria bacterium]|nr:MAG: cytochrome c oxidase subunit 3 family protein [Gammaproteobacteria bacterium]